MKILILGHKGLLGRDIIEFNKFFKQHEIATIDELYRWPDINFKHIVKKIDCDIIINCISIENFENINQVKSIYFDLPLFLSEIKNKYVINFTSDILNSNAKKMPDVNNYYLFKKNAEKILNPGSFLNVRTSFFGLSNTKSNLLNKKFNNSSTIIGYTNLKWSGVTTLQIYHSIANFIEIIQNNISKINLSSECISNYDLLVTINEVFGFKHEVTKKIYINSESRCSKSDLIIPNITTQIKDLFELKSHFQN